MASERKRRATISAPPLINSLKGAYMSPPITLAGTQPQVHSSESARVKSASTRKTPKPDNPTSLAAPSPEQATVALRHVTANIADNTVRSLQNISAADRQ